MNSLLKSFRSLKKNSLSGNIYNSLSEDLYHIYYIINSSNRNLLF